MPPCRRGPCTSQPRCEGIRPLSRLYRYAQTTWVCKLALDGTGERNVATVSCRSARKSGGDDLLPPPRVGLFRRWPGAKPRPIYHIAARPYHGAHGGLRPCNSRVRVHIICGSKRPCSRGAASKAGRACHKSLLGRTMQRCHQLRAAFQEVVPCQRPGGRANSAKARAASQTPERRREVARKAAAARWAK